MSIEKDKFVTFTTNDVNSTVPIIYICKVDYSESNNTVTLNLLDGSIVVISDITGDFYEKIKKYMLLVHMKRDVD
jgi:hypothetical protein